MDAEAAARWSILLAETGRSVAGAMRAGALLIAQRRLLEARATLAPVDGAEADDACASTFGRPSAEPRTEPAMVEAFLEILRTCQEVDDAIDGADAGGDAPARVAGGQRGRVRDRAIAIGRTPIAHAGGVRAVGRRSSRSRSRVLDTGVVAAARRSRPGG